MTVWEPRWFLTTNEVFERNIRRSAVRVNGLIFGGGGPFQNHGVSAYRTSVESEIFERNIRRSAVRWTDWAGGFRSKTMAYRRIERAWRAKSLNAIYVDLLCVWTDWAGRFRSKTKAYRRGERNLWTDALRVDRLPISFEWWTQITYRFRSIQCSNPGNAEIWTESGCSFLSLWEVSTPRKEPLGRLHYRTMQSVQCETWLLDYNAKIAPFIIS